MSTASESRTDVALNARAVPLGHVFRGPYLDKLVSNVKEPVAVWHRIPRSNHPLFGREPHEDGNEQESRRLMLCGVACDSAAVEWPIALDFAPSSPRVADQPLWSSDRPAGLSRDGTCRPL